MPSSITGNAFGNAGRRAAGVVGKISNASARTSGFDPVSLGPNQLLVGDRRVVFSNQGGTGFQFGSARGTKPAAGRVYMEMAVMGYLSSGTAYVGLCNLLFNTLSNASTGSPNYNSTSYPGSDANSVSIKMNDTLWYNGARYSPYPNGVPTGGSVMSFAVDLGAGVFYVAFNGVWQNSTSFAGAIAYPIPFAGPVYPVAQLSYQNLSSAFINTGQDAFFFPVPPGFQPWG